MADKNEDAAIAKLSFEEALAELEEIVGALEDGDSDLDKAITAYERGTKLKKHCEAKLKEAKARIDKISVDPEGNSSTEPADIDQ